MALKSKLIALSDYKGLIDGKVRLVKKGEEFLCDPDLAIKLVAHYPKYFEVIGSERLEAPKAKEEPKKSSDLDQPEKKFKPKSNKKLTDYENK